MKKNFQNVVAFAALLLSAAVMVGCGANATPQTTGDEINANVYEGCLLYTSPSPRD